MTTAVLVIDLQIGVLEGCWDAAGVVSRTAALVERARSEGAVVVWVQHEEPGLDRDTPVWEMPGPLVPTPDEARIFKQYRDAFASTDLAAELEEAAVDSVVVAGAQSDYCVRTTAQSAAARGLDLTLVSDCHTTRDAGPDSNALAAPQIIAHTNLYFAGLRYPHVECRTARSDAVALLTPRRQ